MKYILILLMIFSVSLIAKDKQITQKEQKTKEAIQKAMEDEKKIEKEQKFLESTGSMVFDFDNNIAYAVESDRTNEALFTVFCNINQLQGFYFCAFDMNGVPIYHTNVMMSSRI